MAVGATAGAGIDIAALVRAISARPGGLNAVDGDEGHGGLAEM